MSLPWRNRTDGQRIEVTTTRGGEPGKVRLKTYADVVRDYRLHPEVKSADLAGGPCNRGTVGYLLRRPVLATGVRHIGQAAQATRELDGP